MHEIPCLHGVEIWPDLDNELRPFFDIAALLVA